MDIVSHEIETYLAAFDEPEDEVLAEMGRLGRERGFPIVGPGVGRLLEVLALSLGARRVLELGSGFGYSAYWLARAVGPAGLVVLTDRSASLLEEARGFLARGALDDRVRFEVGPALEVARRLDEEFDLVLNDVDKEDYGQVLDVARQRLRPGGVLVSDNMLWYGRVLEPEVADAETRGVLSLTRQLKEARDFRTCLLPIRDGVTVSVRRSRG